MGKQNKCDSERNKTNARNHKSNGYNKGKAANVYKGKQGRKDSKDPRVNDDNERLSKFDKQYKVRGSNDVEWYTKNPELLKSAASLPFASILGNQLFPFSQAVVPGVMRIEFAWAFGNIDEYNGYPTALNQAGKSLYSYLVHANSRNYTYEYQDLMTVILAGAQVYAALSHVVRAYGVVKYYAEQSRYTPDALLTLMGFQPDDVRRNLSKMWFDINDLITQTTQIWIPNTLPLIKRWFWMCANVYRDAESAKSQLYMFVPHHFLMFTEDQMGAGSGLEPATYQDTTLPATPYRTLTPIEYDGGYTWEKWRGTIQHMIDRLVNSEDRGIMFGDILNAYGADKIYAMSPIQSDYRVEPAFSKEVLMEIENLTVQPSFVTGLRQDAKGLAPLWNAVVSGEALKTSSKACPDNVILNFHTPTQPTVEEITVGSRLTSVGYMATSAENNLYSISFAALPKEDSSSLSQLTVSSVGQTKAAVFGMLPTACGSETVTGISTVVPGDLLSPGPWTIQSINANLVAQDASAAMTRFSMWSQWAAFDWHPFLYSIQATTGHTTSDPVLAGTTQSVVLNAAGDFDNYSVFESVILRKLHDVVLFSLFGVPQM